MGLIGLTGMGFIGLTGMGLIDSAFMGTDKYAWTHVLDS